MAKFIRRKVFTSKYQDVLRAKWPGTALDEGYVPFPKRLLRAAPKLFRGKDRMKQLCAMLAIVDYERPDLSNPASLAYLAFLAGISEEQFERCLNRFTKRRWIEIDGDNDGLSIDYSKFVEAVIAATDGPEKQD